MSSFQCTPEHVAALTGAAVSLGILSASEAPSAFSTLWRANDRGVCAAYKEAPMDLVPAMPAVRVDFSGPQRPGAPLAVRVIKAAHCFAYQCSDSPEWADGDEAFDLIALIIDHATRRLPGYSAADWGWAA